MIWEYIKASLGMILIVGLGSLSLAVFGILVGDLILSEMHKNDDHKYEMTFTKLFRKNDHKEE